MKKTIRPSDLKDEIDEETTELSFTEGQKIPYRRECYTYSGERKERYVIDDSALCKGFKFSFDSPCSLHEAWIHDKIIWMICTLDDSLWICTVKVGGKKAEMKYRIGKRGVFHGTYRMYATGNEQVVFQGIEFDKTGWVVSGSGSDFMTIFSREKADAPICYMEADDRGNPAYILFGESTERVRYVWSGGKVQDVTKIIDPDTRERINAMIRQQIQYTCPEYLAFDMLTGARVSYDVMSGIFTLRTDCAGIRREEENPAIPDMVDDEDDRLRVSYGEFDPYKLVFDRTGQKVYVGSEEFTEEYEWHAFSPDDMPESAAGVVRYLYCCYMENAVRSGRLALRPVMRELQEDVLWWNTPSAGSGYDDPTLCAILFRDHEKNRKYRYFFRKEIRDGEECLLRARTIDDLYGSGATCMRTAFNEKQRENVAATAGYLKETAEHDHIAFFMVAEVLDTYAKRAAFEKGRMDYLSVGVKNADVAARIYCIFALSSNRMAFYADLSDYGFGKRENIKIELGDHGGVYRKEGEYIPFEKTGYPTPELVRDFVPTNGNQRDFQVTGYVRHKDHMNLAVVGITNNGGFGELETVGSGFDPSRYLYDDLTFWVKYKNGWVSHPVLKGIRAYTLLDDGILYATAEGLFKMSENRPLCRIRIPEQGIDPGKIMKIRCNGRKIELDIFDHLGSGRTENVLYMDYYETEQISYKIFTRTVEIG